MQKSRSIRDYFARTTHDQVAQDAEVGDIIVVAQPLLSEQKPGKREWPYSPSQKKRPHPSTITPASPQPPKQFLDLSPSTHRKRSTTSPRHILINRNSYDATTSINLASTAHARPPYENQVPTPGSASPGTTGYLTLPASQDGPPAPRKPSSSNAPAFEITRKGIAFVRSSDDEEEDADEDLACEAAEPSKLGDEPTTMEWETAKEKGHDENIRNRGLATYEEADLDSDSSLTSLEDLDDLIARSKRTVASPPDTSAVAESKEGKPRRSPGAEYLPVTSDYTISLDSLLMRHRKDLAAEADVANSREMMSASVAQALTLSTSSASAKDSEGEARGLDHDLLLAALEDGEEDGEAQRVLQAAQRTEALEFDMTWSFFEAAEQKRKERDPFPCDGLPLTSWAMLLKDTASREQAFLSGFVREIGEHKGLPDETLAWLLNGTVCESRRDLRYAYLRVIQNSDRAKRVLMSSDCLADVLRKLGATSSATALAIPVVPVRRSIEVQAPSEALYSFVDLLRVVSPELPVTAREYAVNILLRMIIDVSIRADSVLQLSIPKTIAALINDMSEAIADSSLHNIGTVLVSTIQDTSLRLHVLSSIPSTTARLHDFRCALAVSYFLCSTHFGAPCQPLRGPGMIALIFDRLSGPEFTITAKTDYVMLSALVMFLDTLVDSGFSNLSICDKESEDIFNQKVDALARQLRSLGGRIVDSGASHLKRTECKVALDRLVYRLEFGVRTRVRPRKNLFGAWAPSTAGEKSVAFMEQFLKKQPLHPET